MPWQQGISETESERQHGVSPRSGRGGPCKMCLSQAEATVTTARGMDRQIVKLLKGVQHHGKREQQAMESINTPDTVFVLEQLIAS